jgi:hypothetical protein
MDLRGTRMGARGLVKSQSGLEMVLTSDGDGDDFHSCFEDRTIRTCYDGREGKEIKMVP